MKIHTSFGQRNTVVHSTTEKSSPGPDDNTSSPLGKAKYKPGGGVKQALQMCLSSVRQLKVFVTKMTSPNKGGGPSGPTSPGPDEPVHTRQLRPHQFGGMVEPVFTSDDGTIYSSIITQNTGGSPIQNRPLPPLPGESGGGSSPSPSPVYAELDFPGTGGDNHSSKTQSPGPGPDPSEHIYENIDTNSRGKT